MEGGGLLLLFTVVFNYEKGLSITINVVLWNSDIHLQ